MMKMLFKSLALMVLLFLLAILALVFIVDANRFKPRIEALAKAQGVVLQINGDLGWSFWPSLGVAANAVKIAALEQPQQPFAEVQQASLMLKLMPLLGGNFQVDHILVNGLHLSLVRDKSGKGNWEAFSGAAPSNSPAAGTSTSAELTLDIQQLSLADTRVDYQDAQTGHSWSLDDLNLTLSGVNTRSEPFGIDADFTFVQANPSGAARTLSAKVAAQASLDKALNNLHLDDGQLALTLDGKGRAELLLAYSVTITELQTAPSYQGQITLKETNGREWLDGLGVMLDTARPDALGKLAISSNFTGDASKVKLDNLVLLVDETPLKGTASVSHFDRPAIKASLAGEALNLDYYLPPALAGTETGTPSTPATDNLLPLDSLRVLNLNLRFSLQQLTINRIPLEQVEAKLLAKNGMLEYQLSARAYGGQIIAKSQLDTRGQLAQLQFDAGLEGLELAPLLKARQMDGQFGLQGAVQVRALGSSQGNSVDTLLKSLRANANFSGAQVRLSPINLEQQFCKLVNLVNQTGDPVQTWNAYTEMAELSGSLKWRDQVITLDTFKSGVEKLQLGARGKINLATDEYDIFLPFKVLKDKTDKVAAGQVAVTTSASGCSIGSHYWLERGLELLRCKGSFGAINPLSDCRPDKELLTELTKDYATYKLKEKHGATIDAKKQELKEKIDTRKSQLLDKLQQKLNKGAGTSSAEPGASSSSSVTP